MAGEIQTATISAPVGGWNRRDSLGLMPETDAIVMDNFISTGGFVKLRSGYKTVVKTPSSPYERENSIDTICTYTAGLDDFLIFSYRAPGSDYADLCKVYDDMSGYESIVPKDPNTGFPTLEILGTRWKDLQFQNKLFLVSNGTDEPLVFDGTTLEKHGFEVKSPNTLSFKDITDIASYNRRLFFIERGTLNLWFTNEVGTISGELEYNDLSDYATRGGELVEIEEWTRTGANDMSSMLVAITSEGEVFMFSGTDPTEADEWEMSGIYQIPSPIGFHCATRMVGDLVFATKSGYYTAESLTSVKETTKEMAISDKIRGAIEGLRNYYDSDGWQIIFLQPYNLFIINIPISERTSDQLVYNLENQTWSRFTGIPAAAFCVFNDKVYFGGKNGNIYELFKEGTDNGVNIMGAVQTAFSTFNVPQKKHVKSAAINVGTPYKQEIRLCLSCDFNLSEECVVYTEGEDPKKPFAEWDLQEWGVGYWGVPSKAENLNIQELDTPMSSEVARHISLALKTAISAEEDYDFVWHSTTFTYETALQ